MCFVLTVVTGSILLISFARKKAAKESGVSKEQEAGKEAALPGAGADLAGKGSDQRNIATVESTGSAGQPETGETQQIITQEPVNTAEPGDEASINEKDMFSDGSKEASAVAGNETEAFEEGDMNAEESVPADPDAGGDISTDPVTLVFTGDICFHDPFANMGAYRQRGSSIEKCIDNELLTEMKNADICMVNNEFPYSSGGTPTAGKTYTFRSKPENVGILGEMGVDIVSIANNHAFDHGEEAFLDTLDILKGAKVPYVGGGRNIEEAGAPVIMEKKGVKIGFVAATQIERSYPPDTRGATDTLPGVMRCFSEDELSHFLKYIKQADEQCDFLVVFVHWGSENTAVLDQYQTGQAQAFADAGADLIVGCHSHCLQGLGEKSGVPVIFSLGNYWFNSKTVDTALLKVAVQDKKLKSVQMVPALQHDCRTDHLEGTEKTRIIDYLNSISIDGVRLDEDGFLSW